MTNNIRKLKPYFSLYVTDIMIVMTSLCAVSLSLLSLGRLFRNFIDNGLSLNHDAVIDRAILLICTLVIVFAISSFCRSYFINNLTEKIINKIRLDVYDKLLKIEIVNFETLKIGDIIARLTSDMEAIAKLIVSFLSFFIRNFIMLVGSIIMMFIHSPKLSSIVIFAVPLLIIPLMKLGKHSRYLSRKILEMQGTLSSNIEENFNHIRIIHAYNQQQNQFNYFKNATVDYLKHSSLRLRVRSLFFALAISLILFAVIFVIWIGSKDIVKGEMSAGNLLSFIYYAIIAGMSAGGIAEFASEVNGPIAALNRVFDLLDTKFANHSSVKNSIPKTDVDLALTTQSDKRYIEFINTGFSYPSTLHLKTLDNINLLIELGKFTGIVGRSGSGKSTLLQLLLKFYSVSTGEIKIAGANIADINTSILRQVVAYVPQDPCIFSGTIRENIIFSNPTAIEDDILYIANITGVMDFATKLEFGLDTKIGEKGTRLSGGQKQRIAICRALIYKPDILLLDEATSALDSESEQRMLLNIQEFIFKNRMTSNRNSNFSLPKTIISIAHRIVTIEQADRILLIDQGKLVCSGTHNELLQTSGLYRILCDEQSISTKPHHLLFSYPTIS